MSEEYKAGVGVVYDLGSEHEVNGASIALKFAGNHTTATLYDAGALSPSGQVRSMPKIATGSTSDSTLKLATDTPVKARYVLIWITAMPKAPADAYSQAGFKQAITDVKFTG